MSFSELLAEVEDEKGRLRRPSNAPFPKRISPQQGT
jgi:hypothetical protein